MQVSQIKVKGEKIGWTWSKKFLWKGRKKSWTRNIKTKFMAFEREHFKEFENLLNAFFRCFLFHFLFPSIPFFFRCCVSRFCYQFRKIEINKLQLKDLEETTLIWIFLLIFVSIDLCPFAAIAVIYALFFLSFHCVAFFFISKT